MVIHLLNTTCAAKALICKSIERGLLLTVESGLSSRAKSLWIGIKSSALLGDVIFNITKPELAIGTAKIP